MKTLPLLLLAAVLVTGCTSTTTTTTRSTRTTAEAQTGMTPEERRIGNRRSYSHDDLQKTGHPTLGGALQTVDPSVYISGR
ncbi:hypothetical protein BH20VER2_BH20VER2_18290 [soil metagenome]|nr:hypothetical protein [Chthoniobacterales bacterium]